MTPGPGPKQFFARCSLAPGHHGLDLECGGGSGTLDLAELNAFEQDEKTLVSLPRIFQVWAVK